MFLALKTVFNRLLHPGVFPREPTKQFEAWTGLTGIAGQYKFPGGMTGPEFEDKCRAHKRTMDGSYTSPDFLSVFEEASESKEYPPYQRIIFHAWQALKELNPELNRIEMADIYQQFEAFNGVVSGFNVEDINLFLELDVNGQAPGTVSRSLPGVADMRRKIEYRTLTHMQWVASPQTLKKILLAMK